MSPRQRNRRRERRRIIRIDRVDALVDGKSVAAFAIPTFRSTRYNARAHRNWPPVPRFVAWFNERWNASTMETP